MKKFMDLVITMVIFSFLSSAAFADSSAFTPLNFDDTTPAPVVSKTTPISKPKENNVNPISNAFSKIIPQKNNVPADSASNQAAAGNSNIQNAILELDNAQVGIRNDLLNYKAKYSDIDAQFKLIKNQRSVLHRQIVTIERRIRDIDREKEALRKNML